MRAARALDVATLDLRDRTLATTIAYIGAPGAGRATNLASFSREREQGRLSVRRDGVVEWRPNRLDAFDDCDVSVRLVRGEEALLSSDADLDGVVFVADSTPAAAAENQRIAAAIRARLAVRSLSLVVQLNKRDLADAVDADRLRASLALGDCTYVPATAASGEGVIETARRALEGVLTMMKHVDVERRTSAPPRETNPLLSALRAIIEGAVADQMRVLEERLAETSAARDAEIATLRREVGGARKEIGALLAGVVEIERMVRVTTTRLQEIAASVERAATKDDLVLEVGRRGASLEILSRKHHEEVHTAIALLTGTLDDAVVELRKSDAQTRAAIDAQAGRIVAMTASTEAQETILGALSPIGVEVAKIAAQIAALEDRSVAELEARTREIVAASRAVTQSLEERTAALAARIDVVTDELQKPKKGWFG